MWTVAIWFFVIMYAINGFAAWIDAAVDDYSLVSPIDNSTIILPSQPNVTSTLVSVNGTVSSANATGGDDVNIWDTASFAWNSTIFVIKMLTGGFIFDTIGSILPATGETQAVFQIFQGVIGIFLILTILHFWRGIL